ncbi:MAG: mannonate dehydratase [Turicibacter sp.]|nr:mannonate dehydratase [Turicibacter sp.]
MKMTLRWYGPGYDTVSLKDIGQIPGIQGVVTSLMGKLPGELWTDADVAEIQKAAREGGQEILAIESINISDDIKIGTPKREEHIANYIKSLEAVGKAGIKTVCYNFMPVFDWTRTDLWREREDGSFTLAYNQEIIDKVDVTKLKESMEEMSGGHLLPGWEPERMERIAELFEAYKDVTEEILFENLVYFLNAIEEVCNKYDIKMAIHPDDPAWPIFGLPRIITNKEQIVRLLTTVDKPHNNLTFCSGSLGTNPKNDMVAIIHAAKGRIPFAHLRNVRHNSDIDFEESAHLSRDGSVDMFAIIKAFHDTGFDGIYRPDHGRMIWGEKALPGYGLYDRAIGASYMEGIWEALEKLKK